MGARKKQQPTKIQAVFMALVALVSLGNTALVVGAGGRPLTVPVGIAVALELGLLAVSVWLYRRAMKLPPQDE